MKETKVKEIRQFVTIEPAIVLEETSLNEIIDMFINNPVTRSVYVVNKKDKLVGIITIQDILKHISVDISSLSALHSGSDFFGYSIVSSGKRTTAKKLMNPEIYYVYDDDPIDKAFNIIFKKNTGGIPVLDTDGNIVGDLNIVELLVLWQQNN